MRHHPIHISQETRDQAFLTYPSPTDQYPPRGVPRCEIILQKRGHLLKFTRNPTISHITIRILILTPHIRHHIHTAINSHDPTHIRLHSQMEGIIVRIHKHPILWISMGIHIILHVVDEEIYPNRLQISWIAGSTTTFNMRIPLKMRSNSWCGIPGCKWVCSQYTFNFKKRQKLILGQIKFRIGSSMLDDASFRLFKTMHAPKLMPACEQLGHRALATIKRAPGLAKGASVKTVITMGWGRNGEHLRNQLCKRVVLGPGTGRRVILFICFWARFHYFHGHFFALHSSIQLAALSPSAEYSILLVDFSTRWNLYTHRARETELWLGLESWVWGYQIMDRRSLSTGSILSWRCSVATDGIGAFLLCSELCILYLLNFKMVLPIEVNGYYTKAKNYMYYFCASSLAET